MVNIENYVHCLKLTWINRLLGSRSSPWVNLCQKSISDVKNLIMFGSEWCGNLIGKNTNINQFWKETFTEPWKGYRTVFLVFFILLPQDSKSFPQDRKSFPQVSKSLPQDTNPFPQVSKVVTTR